MNPTIVCKNPKIPKQSFICREHSMSCKFRLLLNLILYQPTYKGPGETKDKGRRSDSLIPSPCVSAAAVAVEGGEMSSRYKTQLCSENRVQREKREGWMRNEWDGCDADGEMK